MRTSSEYSEQWKDCTRREVRVWIAFFGYVPFMIAAILLAEAIGFDPNGAVGFVLFGAYVLGVMVPIGIWARVFPCPRCGKRFYHGANRWGRRCANCGLPKCH